MRLCIYHVRVYARPLSFCSSAMTRSHSRANNNKWRADEALRSRIRIRSLHCIGLIFAAGRAGEQCCCCDNAGT